MCGHREVIVVDTPAVKLASGYWIPALGLGTAALEGEECVTAVRTALGMGYNHIDTADMYGNQAEIGRATAGYYGLLPTLPTWTHF